MCPHLGVPLKDGRLTQDGGIQCPQHNSVFNVKTGEVMEWLPGDYWNKLQRFVSKEEKLEAYPTKIENGMIYVNMVSKRIV